MIVLNGEPFTRYNLRAMYPFAHEIIIVEGACPTAKDYARPDGHSKDGTLEILYEFQSREDPERKVTIVTAKEENHLNGFWLEKDEMSQTYAKRATGDYLWQVDVDEFYRSDQMQYVIEMLRKDPDIKAVTFRAIQFWGGIEYRTDGFALRRGAYNFHRIFAWKGGYRYTTHRPPTVIDEHGRSLRDIKTITGNEMARRGIFLYHYSFLFPFQIRFKLAYYGGWDNFGDKLPNLIPEIMHKRKLWANNFFYLKKPFLIDDTSVRDGPSWIRHFKGEPPEPIQQLWRDIREGKILIDLRTNEDVKRLLKKPWYRIAIAFLTLTCSFLDNANQIRRAFYRTARVSHNFKLKGKTLTDIKHNE